MDELTRKEQAHCELSRYALKVEQAQQCDLYNRFRKLPRQQSGLVEQAVLCICHVSRKTFGRVLRGQSENLKVLVAMASILNCRVDDLLNPTFVLPDPKLSEDILLEKASN